MPVYEYKCPKCNHETEVEMKMTANDVVLCSVCHENSNGMHCTVMNRQISLGNFSLKGSGWYRDGYSSKK